MRINVIGSKTQHTADVVRANLDQNVDSHLHHMHSRTWTLPRDPEAQVLSLLSCVHVATSQAEDGE
jgi:hypothetical protein